MGFAIPNFAAVGIDDPRSVGGLPSFPKESPTAEAEAVLGAGVQKAGLAVSDIDLYRQLHRDKADRATANADFLGRVIPITEALKTETDPEKITAFRGQYQEAANVASGAIGNEEARKLWLAQNAEHVVRGQAHADARGKEVYFDRWRGGQDVIAANIVRQATAAADPAAIPAALKALDELYTSSHEVGARTADQAFAQQKAAEYQLIDGSVQGLINRGRPDAAKAMLDQYRDHLAPITAEALQKKIEIAGGKAADAHILDGIFGGPIPGTTGPRGARNVERFLDLTENIESGSRNIMQRVLPAGGGLNPSTGTVTGPSTAQGYFQITNSTWGEFAPQAGVDTAQYPNAMSAPREVQRAVARTIATTSGVQHWTDFNKDFRAAAQREGFPVTGPIATEAGAAPDQLAAAPTAPSSPMTAPVPGIPTREELIAKIPEGLTEERYNHIYAGINRRYNQMMQATSADRATALQQYKGGLEMLQDGREFPIDPGIYRRLFPTDTANEMIGNLQDAQTVGQQITSLRGMPLQDIVSQRVANQEILNRSTGEGYAKQRKLTIAFDKAADAHLKALGDDPAGYLQMWNPDIRAAADAMRAETPQAVADARAAGGSTAHEQYAAKILGEQERLGVPEDARHVISNLAAQQLVKTITTADPAKTDIGLELQNIANLYGSAWPQVMGDLKRAKLPPVAEALMSMTPEPGKPDIQAAARADFQQALRVAAEKGGARTLRGAAPQDQAKDIDTNVDNTLADFRATVRNPELYSTMENAVKELAYFYAFRGEKAPLEKAYQGIIAQKYDFDGRLRVPKGALATVEQAGAQVIATVAPEQLGPIPGNPLLTPQERLKIYLGALPRGYWVTNAGDDGAELMLPVRDGNVAARYADGRPISFKFADAPGLAAKAGPPPVDFTSGVYNPQ